MKRILLVEDNPDLAYGLRINLEIEGYTVEQVQDGRVALEHALRRDADLMVLDLMLPGLDGMAVLQQVRAAGIEVPVLILTAKGQEVDRVHGLRAGADDYLTKPFALMELLARIEALLRRAARTGHGGEEAASRFVAGDIEIRPAARQVLRRGEPVDLAPKEFDLLFVLVRNRGRVMSRLELMRAVWRHSSAVVSRTVDTHVAELRRKLGDDQNVPRLITTVRKAGYRFDG